MQIKTLSDISDALREALVDCGPNTETLPCLVGRLGSDLRHHLRDHPITSPVIEDEPEKTGNPALDTWLAGAAEYLAQGHDLDVPGWCLDPLRFLERPLFIVAEARGRKLALIETPSAFRRRNLFCGRCSL